MSDLAGGVIFADGETLTASRLNALLSAAAIQPAFVTGKSQITPVAADYLIFYDTSGTVLAKCLISALITAMQGATAATLAAGNDSRFPASITGIRLGAGAGADTAAKAKDLAFAPTAGGNSGTALTLDCSVNNLFTVTLTGNATITLSNISDGDIIRVRILQDGTGSRTLAWTTTQTKKYVGGAAPTATAGANTIDYWYFERCGNELLTYARQAVA